MRTPTPAFTSTFLPAIPACASTRNHSSCQRNHRPKLTVASSNPPKDPQSVSAKPANLAFPFLATGLAALSVLLGAVPANANANLVALEDTCVQHSRQVTSASRPRRSFTTSTATPVPAVIINADAPYQPPKQPPSTKSPFLITPQTNSSSRQGTLLHLEPTTRQSENDPSPDLGMESPRAIPPPSRSHSASSRAANAVPDWPAPRIQRPMYSADRLLRLRGRVRPAAIGLVGVGALTSGSVILRSMSGKTTSTRANISVEKPSEMCSVVCMHIPFCVPERNRLIEGLERLADSACLVTAEGMAAAARDAAALILEEGGMLEDSRKFAPNMVVCLADDVVAAERRFSGHVEIETHRVERLSGKHVGYDVSPKAKLGQYGVVTLVVATNVGVDLECYDERTAVVKRLRTALDAVCRLGKGNIVGLELRWIPESTSCRPLTRAQLADAFPWLRVA